MKPTHDPNRCSLTPTIPAHGCCGLIWILTANGRRRESGVCFDRQISPLGAGAYVECQPARGNGRGAWRPRSARFRVGSQAGPSINLACLFWSCMVDLSCLRHLAYMVVAGFKMFYLVIKAPNHMVFLEWSATYDAWLAPLHSARIYKV